MDKVTCRVCGRTVEIMDKEDEDFVCGNCCDLGITDKGELQDFLESLTEGQIKTLTVYDKYQNEINVELAVWAENGDIELEVLG